MAVIVNPGPYSSLPLQLHHLRGPLIDFIFKLGDSALERRGALTEFAPSFRDAGVTICRNSITCLQLLFSQSRTPPIWLLFRGGVHYAYCLLDVAAVRHFPSSNSQKINIWLSCLGRGCLQLLRDTTLQVLYMRGNGCRLEQPSCSAALNHRRAAASRSDRETQQEKVLPSLDFIIKN